MRRNRISRSLASVLAVWLAVCLAEPIQLHTCAMHGGLAMGQTSGTTGHSHSASGQSHHDQNTDNESLQCSCLGDCSAGRYSIGIAAAGVSLLADATVDGSATDFDYASPRLVAAPFLLPFSNGPPAGSSRA